MGLTPAAKELESLMRLTFPGVWLLIFILTAVPGIAAEALSASLHGIVWIEKSKVALLEIQEQAPWGAFVTRKPILKAGERDGTFAVTAIDEKTATVSAKYGDKPMTLRLEQAPGEELANRTLNFESADLRQVLYVYQVLCGRTLISKFRALPRITLKSKASLSSAEATELLTRAFTSNGISVKLSGKDFAFVVDTNLVKQLSEFPEPPPSEARFVTLHRQFLALLGIKVAAPTLFPPGMIKFQDSDTLQVLDIYQDLSGRTILRPEQLPPGKISVQSQTPMTRPQAVWLLDALLFLQGGVAMRAEGDKFAFGVPNSEKRKLPKLTSAETSAKTIPALPLKFSNASIEQMAEVYSELSGREALPDTYHVYSTKFSLKNQQELSREEALFALETVAALNNLKIERVSTNQFQILPAAAAKLPKKN